MGIKHRSTLLDDDELMRRFHVRRRRVHVRWTLERKLFFRTTPVILPRDLESESEREAEPERDTATDTETDQSPLTDEERRKRRLDSGQT